MRCDTAGGHVTHVTPGCIYRPHAQTRSEQVRVKRAFSSVKLYATAAYGSLLYAVETLVWLLWLSNDHAPRQRVSRQSLVSSLFHQQGRMQTAAFRAVLSPRLASHNTTVLPIAVARSMHATVNRTAIRPPLAEQKECMRNECTMSQWRQKQQMLLSSSWHVSQFVSDYDWSPAAAAAVDAVVAQMLDTAV